MLPCLHSFCSICLQSFVQSFVSRQKEPNRGADVVVSVEPDAKSLSRTTTFECPTCREKVSVADLPRGIHSLPSNFWIVSMVDALNHVEARASSDNGCDICPEDDRDEAGSRCTDCNLFLCQLHTASHAKSRETRYHTLVNLEKPENPDSEAIEAEKLANSGPHPKPLSIDAVQPSDALGTAETNPAGQIGSEISSVSKLVVHTTPLRVGYQATNGATSASSSSEATSRRPTPSPQYRCSDHPEELLRLFCDTCQVPICRDCALVEHREHAYSFLDKSGEVHRKRLASAMRVTHAQIQGIQKLEARVNELWNLVRVNSNDALLSIRELFAEVKALIDRREQELLVQVETSRQERLMYLHQQKENLEASRTLLQNAYTSSSEIHDQASEIELLMLQNTLITRLSTLACKVDMKTLESDSLRLTLPGSPIGRLTFASDSSVAKNAISALGRLTVTDSIIAPLGDGKRTLSSSSLIKRLYDRLTAPILRIGASEMAEESESPAFLEPWGVAVSEREEIVVVDASRACIHIESPPASSITRSITLPSDKHDPIPIGVIFDTFGNIVVSDQANHMVKVLLPGGGCKGLGIEGSEPCQFNRPAGLAIDVRSEADGGVWIWVVDQGNRRIQAFAQPLWNHRQTCTQFSEPCAIAIDPKSHRIVVTDTGARLHILQRGSHDIKVTLTIKNYPNYDEDIPAATGIAIDEDGNAIIADTFQNKILVVRLSDGQIISQIGTNSSFKAPRGLCISPSGKLFITDHHRIQAF